MKDNHVLNHYEYDVWGNLTVCEETVENRFKYNGQQFDPISQQYYLRARYYNPVIGRFTQEDTYRGDGLNLYAYCRNNPVFYIDPSGHMCEKGVDRVTGEINARTATKDDVKNLSSHIREKLRNGGTLTDQERNVAKQLGIDVQQDNQQSSAYDTARAKGLTAAEAYYIATGKNALNQAGSDYMAMREQQKIMDRYQQSAIQNYAKCQNAGNARQVGTKTHTEVRDDMTDYWNNNKGYYPYIKDVSIENSYLNGRTSNYNAAKSSRIDIVITNNANNIVHIADLKTGSEKINIVIHNVRRMK